MVWALLVVSFRDFFSCHCDNNAELCGLSLFDNFLSQFMCLRYTCILCVFGALCILSFVVF
jgi:hypothetical protein